MTWPPSRMVTSKAPDWLCSSDRSADAVDLADGAADELGGAEHGVDAHQPLDLAAFGIAEAFA